MQSCIGKIAQSIGMDCSSPIVGGYTGRAIIVDASDDIGIGFVHNTGDPRVVTDTLGWNVACLCDNSMLSTPFEGSTTTGTNENGMPEFVKVFNGRILSRGADVSKDIVEVLANGRFIIVLEKRETRMLSDVGGLEIVGSVVPAKCVDKSIIVRNENENGGTISFGLQTTEPYFEVDLVFQRKTQTNHQLFDEWFGALYGQSVYDLASAHSLANL